MRINRNNVDGLLTAIRCATMISYDVEEHYLAISSCHECIFGSKGCNAWRDCSSYEHILCRSEMMNLVKNDYNKILRLLQTSVIQDENVNLPDFKQLWSEYKLIEKLLKENKNGN